MGCDVVETAGEVVAVVTRVTLMRCQPDSDGEAAAGGQPEPQR